MRYESFIATRHLLSTKGSFLSTLTLLAVAGVMLGVIAFTSVISVAGGFVDAFRERVLGVNSHILITKHGLYFSEYEAVQEAIEEVDGILTTAPFILHEMLITSPNSRSRPGALVKGIEIEQLYDTTKLDELLVDGSLDNLVYSGQFAHSLSYDTEQPTENLVGVVLGHVLADRLAVDVGDTVTLVSPIRGLEAVGWRNDTSTPTYSLFRVDAIADTGFFDYDARLVLIDYRALQALFGRGDVVTGIEIRVDDVFGTAEIMDQMDQVLPVARYRMLDWPQINRNLFASLKLQKLALTLVMSIFVVVASFVILSVLIMLVIEKRREIAILRSMGASRMGIVRIFVFEGMIIGITGTVLGLIGGYFMTELIGLVHFGLELEVYRIDHLPVTARPIEFAAAAAGTLFWCFIATLYPAWRAANVSPVEALRYD